MLRFHLLGLPHCPTHTDFCHCAYTSKVWKFGKMMTNLGHEVYHYGVQGSNLQCTKHYDMGGYSSPYKPCTFDKTQFGRFNQYCNNALRQNCKPTDFILPIGGLSQEPALAGLLSPIVEYGIGYYGVMQNSYKCFESYAHMHIVYGQHSKDPDGRFCDAVIPNYFDLDDFTYNAKPKKYYLFMGRLIHRKGLDIAIEATRRAGVQLKVCGGGRCPKAPHVEYVGMADIKQRNDLMRNAIALICPTLYVEPFGGVNVEAQLCGTPVICTDFGAFTETVEQGRTGYRCHTMKEFVDAIDQVTFLDREIIHQRACNTYSLEAIGRMYEVYFTRLYNMLFNGGWYA